MDGGLHRLGMRPPSRWVGRMPALKDVADLLGAFTRIRAAAEQHIDERDLRATRLIRGDRHPRCAATGGQPEAKVVIERRQGHHRLTPRVLVGVDHSARSGRDRRARHSRAASRGHPASPLRLLASISQPSVSLSGRVRGRCGSGPWAAGNESYFGSAQCRWRTHLRRRISLRLPEAQWAIDAEILFLGKAGPASC